MPALPRYQLVDVVFTPLRRKIRFEILSPIYCLRMNARVQSRGSWAVDDLMCAKVFGSRSRAERFLLQGRPLMRTMRLSTLFYDPCDFAIEPASSIRHAQGRKRRHPGSPRTAALEPPKSVA